MSDWSPATEVEAAMRDALLAADQELYFQILARSDLLLPVSVDALAGRVPMGWGTWTTGNRTHILAFTSPHALHVCLNEPAGSYRAVPFSSLAAEWPNYEWWLAIDPGLPIEAYLPSWFVSQLTRGDVRLPGRTMGARARMAQSDLSSALGGRLRAGTAGSAPRPDPTTDPFTDPLTARSATPPRSSVPPSSPPPAFASPSFTPSAPTPPPSAPYSPPHSSPHSPPLSPPLPPVVEPVEARVITSNGRIPPVETVDAEIIDDVPAPGAARGYVETPPAGGYGYESSRGFDTGRASDRDESQRTGWPGGARGYEPPSAPSAPPTPVEPERPVGGFFQVSERNPSRERERFSERDLGARLRERFGDQLQSTPAYGSSSRVGFADPATPYVEPEATVSFGAERPPPPASAAPSFSGRDTIEDAEIVSNADAWAVGFVPANETESSLLAAAEANNTDSFLSTLLLARVILPVPISMPPGSRPRDKYFPWQIEESDGQRFIAVFTSPERMAEHGQDRFGPDISSMSMRFIELIAAWPSENIAFTINPGSPVGATLPGSQLLALAAWADEVGLRDDPAAEMVVAAKKNESVPSLGVAGAPSAGAASAIVMQRTVPPSQLPFYLERGYDRVSGFVNRASEVAHLNSPRVLYRALGLVYSGSPFSEDDAEVHVLRWVAHRADLYRLPYGGQHEAAMRAMQGWVIERPPFRGNGFAPGDTDVVAEFKVDSARLPHGAQMWRLTKDGTETLIASFDADAGRWVSTP